MPRPPLEWSLELLPQTEWETLLAIVRILDEAHAQKPSSKHPTADS